MLNQVASVCFYSFSRSGDTFEYLWSDNKLLLDRSTFCFNLETAPPIEIVLFQFK